MNQAAIRKALIVLMLFLPSRSLAGIPAGAGGFTWRTTTPQGNTLRGVIAPIAGTNGIGLTVVGDASTLLIRQKPFPLTDDSAWHHPRGVSKRDDVAFSGVAVLRPEGLMAVCTDHGFVLLNSGAVFSQANVSSGKPLRAILMGRVTGGLPAIAVVGDYGAAYVSQDGGLSFMPSTITPAGVGQVDLRAVCAANGSSTTTLSRICAVGSLNGHGVILLSEDAGRTYLQTTAAPLCDAFLDVQFVNANLGYILGVRQGAGVTLRTDTGGHAWTEVGVCDGSMRSIAVAGSSVIVAVGGTGIFRSTNGGQGFEPVLEPFSSPRSPVPLERVVASENGAEFWAVGAGGVMFRSSDSGATWHTQDEGLLNPANLQDIFALRYLTNTHLVAAGADGTLLDATGPGPLSPVPVAGAELLHEPIHALAVSGSRNAGSTDNPVSTAFALGGRRSLVAFDGVARTGALLAVVPRADFRGVSAISTAQGPSVWLVGAGGTIAVSTANSPFWRVTPAASTQDLNSIRVVTTASGSIFGLAGGSGGTVLKTNDGAQWTPSAPLPEGFTTASVFGVTILASAGTPVGIVVGERGLIARTTDGGASWTRVPVSTVATLNAVAASRETTSGLVYVAGDSQTVLRSNDGGMTFAQEPLPIPGSPPPVFAYRSVDILTGGDVFLGGEQGHLLYRKYGDGSWQELGGTGNETYFSVRFNALRTGVAVGSGAGGVVKVSTDAGVSFQSPTLPATGTAVFRAVDVVDSLAVIAGDGGVVLRAVDTSLGAGSTFVPETGSVRAAASPKAGWFAVVGDDALFAFSSDGGANWKRSAVDNPFGQSVQLLAIGFAPPDAANRVFGFAAGATADGGFPVLFLSSNMGVTWTPYPINFGQENAPINALAVISAQELLAAATNGAVYHLTGQGWVVERPAPGFTGAWHTINAAPSRWYVAGDNGVVARWPASDGKLGWERLASGVTADMHSMGVAPIGGLPGGDSLKDDICAIGGVLESIVDTSTGGATLFCDVDRDAVITGADALAVLKSWAGLLEPTALIYFYGDVFPPAPDGVTIPGDGYLTLEDAVTVLRTAFGL